MLRWVITLGLCCTALSLDNGLALTPPMGLSTWSVFRSAVNDSLVRELADAMAAPGGLLDAGYTYLLIDDGWAGDGCTGCAPHRNASGHLVADAAKFPHGLRALSDYVRGRGLLFGLWFGHDMCAASNDTAREYKDDDDDDAARDAAFFAAAGVDALKHDNCVDVPNTTAAVQANYDRYARLGAALNATGRPVMYDVVLQVAHARAVPSYDYGYLWSPEVYGRAAVGALGNMWWSLPVNKYNCWSCCVGASNENIVDDAKCVDPAGRACRRGLLPMLDAQDNGTPGFDAAGGHWSWGGPGGWNHLDQLATCVGASWYGPGFTPTEQIAQVSLWAVLASPLIVSFDVRLPMSDACRRAVTNSRAIAVHQDALGVPGRRLKNVMAPAPAVPSGTSAAAAAAVVAAQVWGRPLAGGAVAAVFFNRGEQPANISASFAELGLGAAVASASALDVWGGGAATPGVRSPFTATNVEPHGVLFVTLTPETQTVASATLPVAAAAGSRDPPAPTCHECALSGNCAPAGPYCQGCSYDPAVSGYCMNGGCCCNC